MRTPVKMRPLVIVATVAVLSAVVSAEVNSTNTQPDSVQPKFDNVDWELSKAMGIMKKYENVVMSPISLRVVLGLLLDAANGTTADEIAKFLQIDAEHLTDKDKIRKHFHELIESLNKPTDSSLTSDVVTRIFADQKATLNETFLKLVKENYGTDLDPVDFTQVSDVIKRINKWAEGATHGHIRDLLSESDTDSNAVMLLLNVIFFNGLWTNPFEENDTKPEKFYLNDRQFINAMMMKAQHELQYAQTYDGELQLLRLPYQGGSFAMYFVLPRNRNGLDDLIKNVTPAKIHSLMKTMSTYNVNITLPKFKFSYNIGLKPVLEKFGIKTMFQTAADFSNMENNSSSLFVSNILQKAGIEVNEKGSTAYASTVAEVQNKFGGVTTVEFRADRPFLFFIEEDKTRTVVFVGKVTNPVSYTQSVNQPQKIKNATTEATTKLPESPNPSRPQKPNQTQHEPTQERDREQEGGSLDAAELLYFDVDLLEAIGHEFESKNIVLSPLSIKTLLGLLLHGAEGSTASELQMTLHLSDNITEAEYQLQRMQKDITLLSERLSVKSANAFFFANELQPKREFEEYAVRQFFSTISRINVKDPLSATNKVNNWIIKETEGLVPTVITPGLIKQDTKVISVSAVYFKAKWLYKFPKEATRPQLFYKNRSENKCVQMMSVKATIKYSYEKDINAEVIQIPFVDSKYTFVVIQPRNINGIQRLQSDVKHRSLVNLLSDQDSFDITLSLPKFMAEFEIELTDKLKYLRITEIFEDTAKLPNIIEGEKSLKIDAMVHKAYIQVDEEGTKAGAATVAAVVPLMSPSRHINVVVDRPFLFFIYHSESNLILFEGRINQPEEANHVDCQATQNQKPINMVLDEIYKIDIRNQQNRFALTPTNLTTAQQSPPTGQKQNLPQQNGNTAHARPNPVLAPSPSSSLPQNVKYNNNQPISPTRANSNLPQSDRSPSTNKQHQINPNSHSTNNNGHGALIFPNSDEN